MHMVNISRSPLLRDAHRIVVKVGSSLVTNDGRGLDDVAIGEWCRQLAHLIRNGREVIMVSSGAIAEGMKRLGWTTRPKAVQELQAAAAVGQMGLAQMYETKLKLNGLGSAQVLLTHADLADRERYLNARSTLLTLLKLGVVPVINENDTVVNDEIKFGDNDTLGALVANLICLPIADKLHVKLLDEETNRTLIIDGILMIRDSKSPTLVREMLLAYLPEKHRHEEGELVPA